MVNQIIQGDSLEVLKTLPDNSIDAIITDPPYGIDYQSAWRIDKSQWKPKIANDKTPFTGWTDDAFRVLKNDSPLLCFTRWDTESTFREALTNSGFVCKQQVIWDKVIHGMGDLKGDFASQHENIIYAVKGRFIFDGKRPKSILRYQRVSPDSLKHPNEKPTDLLTHLVEIVSRENATILDPFAGSGTTGIACKRLNRNFIGIELSEEYCEIAKKRIEAEPLKLAI